ncbi:arf-GAP with dual PH domain-containing protein 1-like [Hydractinia symbiolongicarpus]|uniref:arf-GAP with dual PH domain-containing protein 1-like n=1 Tax=Hydractinia symbiolongicarpus TaxID=13093 RepID=UPI00254C74FF|nr:arf-GAP with dual PH domain-containing protein 1-like [Hydractinia symbiolongicarpus]
MTSEQCKQRLLELLKVPGNEKCADCSATVPPPDFISLNLGLFVCIKCSGVHRSLGTRYSSIKSIHLDTFDTEKCNAMERMGNALGARKWEHSVPDCWPPVSKSDYEDLIEQWIKAKYERQEFVDGAGACKQSYANGSKYGWMLKKEKKSKNWNKRFFVLSSQQGYLCYFIRQEEAEPKQRIHISQVNVMLLADDITHRKHSMLITFPIHRNGYSKQRHIYTYTESSFETIDWYLAIRAARLIFLQPFLYGVEKPVVEHLLTRRYLKMGYLHKTGSKSGDGWKKRFVCIDTHRFCYFEKALDAEPLGEVDIESYNMNCFAMEGIEGNHPNAPSKHCFMVHSQIVQKGRNPVFNFCAESREEMLAWLAAFRKAMKKLEWLDPISDKSQRISILSNFSSRCLSDA